jgi:arabinogalactan endo-1,4-beta-galactosidase
LSGLALSIPNSSTQVGTELRQYTYYGMTSQNWAFDEMSPLDVGMRYAILSRNSGKAVDVDGFAATDGANIIQYDWFNTGKQCWLVNSLGGAEQTFSNVATGKIIEVGGYSNNDGGNINQWGWAGHNWQRWTVEAVDSDAGGFWYKIVNVGSGKVVDIAGMSNANMANIQQWTYWGGYNQQWRFVRVN